MKHIASLYSQLLAAASHHILICNSKHQQNNNWEKKIKKCKVMLASTAQKRVILIFKHYHSKNLQTFFKDFLGTHSNLMLIFVVLLRKLLQTNNRGMTSNTA